MPPAIDSREYAIAFELGVTDDCPADFDLPASLDGFDTGLFLPRDDADWFGRSSYPPRVLLLKDHALHVVAHPSAGEAARGYPLDQVSAVESGHMLLKGWLRFTGAGFDRTLGYNTRGLGPVFRFMRRVREKWLHRVQPEAASQAQAGDGLDIKFANALARELDSGETVLLQVFQAPEVAKTRRWLFPQHRWMAGDLLALTGRRLLWITDRERRAYAPYGSIASYAPLDAVLGIGVAPGRGGQVLQVDLRGGSAWRVPIPPESRCDWQQVAGNFAAVLDALRQPLQ